MNYLIIWRYIKEKFKIFFYDLGLANYLVKNADILSQTNEYGGAVEVFVLEELVKNKKVWDKIMYWQDKQKHEVDFVLRRDNKILPIEVKSGFVEKIPNSLKYFIDNYHPFEAFVLNEQYIDEVIYNNCKVRFMPIWHVGSIGFNE